MRRLALEAWASARAQPVGSTLTMLVIAGMVVTVMMTTGRTVAAEQEVLSSIDSVGTRTIQIRAEDAAGVTGEILERIRAIEGIEWAGAFSSAVDGRNARIPGGPPVAVRYVYSDRLEALGILTAGTVGASAFASQAALDLLGLPDVAGAITLTDGLTATVYARLDAPDFLDEFEPIVLVPGETPASTPVNLVFVIAESPELVAPVADAVLSVVGADDPSRVTVQTSESLAALRSIIKSQLANSSRSLVLGVLGVASGLVATILFGLVMMRRKDFGRRRALGATRGFIVRLLIAQTALLATAGVITGVLLSVGIAVTVRDPIPGPTFVLALGTLGLAAAVAAAVPPAMIASRREPIRELRVP